MTVRYHAAGSVAVMWPGVNREWGGTGRSWAGDENRTAPIIHPYKEKAFRVLPKFPVMEQEGRSSPLTRPGLTLLL